MMAYVLSICLTCTIVLLYMLSRTAHRRTFRVDDIERLGTTGSESKRGIKL